METSGWMEGAVPASSTAVNYYGWNDPTRGWNDPPSVPTEPGDNVHNPYRQSPEKAKRSHSTHHNPVRHNIIPYHDLALAAPATTQITANGTRSCSDLSSNLLQPAQFPMHASSSDISQPPSQLWPPPGAAGSQSNLSNPHQVPAMAFPTANSSIMHQPMQTFNNPYSSQFPPIEFSREHVLKMSAAGVSPANSSPASLSPIHSPVIGGPRSVSPCVDAINSLLVDFALTDTLEKVQFIMDVAKRTYPENDFLKVQQKMDIFYCTWQALPSETQLLVQRMVFAMSSNLLDVALKCLVRLSVEHPSQVLTWSVAFKKLIRHLQSVDTLNSLS
jgi:hypothetical protein